MKSTNKLIKLLWTVIGVLLVGGIIGAFLLINHINSLDDQNTQLSGDKDSLLRQLKEAKMSPTPTVPPLPTPTQASPTPTPKPTATPKTSARSTTTTPTPTPVH